MRHANHSSITSTTTRRVLPYWPLRVLQIVKTSIWINTTTPELRCRLLARIAAITALLVQTALLALAYYVMHLALDMADLWLELANTHLALTS